MISRKYTKRIQVWGVTHVLNAFGGSEPVEVLLSKSWAQIKSGANNTRTLNKLTEIGIKDPVNTIIINVRHRNDLNYTATGNFIKYKGIRYDINNAPLIVDLENVDVQIIATRDKN